MRADVAGGDRERWFVPPRLRTAADEAEPRHASWLELFFDLGFVVAITELSRQLVADHSVDGFLRFAALFFPVYVAWQRSEEHTSELQSQFHLVCRLLLEKKKNNKTDPIKLTTKTNVKYI